MDRKLTSLVDEISDYIPRTQRDRDLVLESRARQVIASAGHLVRLIEENFSAEVADDLTRKLLNAVRTGDAEKFARRMRHARGHTEEGEE